MKSFFYFFIFFSWGLILAQEFPKNISEKIHQLHQEYFKNADSPGIAVLVLHHHQIIYQKGKGFAHLEKKVQVSPKTLFYIASVSKMFTSMAIMILEEQGKLKFSDSLATFFPEFPTYAKKITIQHLLQHTSGLPDYIERYEEKPRSHKNIPIEVYCLQLLAQEKELLFSPGTQYEYSNSGYFLLALIVEKVSGQKFPDFIRESVMAPLEMKSSYVVSEKKYESPLLAVPYEKENKKFKALLFGKSPLDLIYGDGGVITNLEDMAKWHQAWTSETLVSNKTLKKALKPTTLKTGKISPYGFGIDLDTEEFDTLVIGHDGSWSGWNACFYHCPENKITTVILSNQDPFEASELATSILGLFFSDDDEDK